MNWLSITPDLRGMPSIHIIESDEPIVRIDLGIGSLLCIQDPYYLQQLAAAATKGAAYLLGHQAGERS